MANENKPAIYSSVLGFRLTMDVSVVAPLDNEGPNTISNVGSGIAVVNIKYGDLEQIKEAITKLEQSCIK